MVGKIVKEKTDNRYIADAVASRIKALRKRLGMNQTQLAEQIGVSQRTVSEWETGDHMPPPIALMALGRLEPKDEIWWYEQAGPQFADRLKTVRLVEEAREKRRKKNEAGDAVTWNPELLTLVIETVDAKLKKMGKKLPISKYAEMIALMYEYCQQLEHWDSDIVERFLKIA